MGHLSGAERLRNQRRPRELKRKYAKAVRIISSHDVMEFEGVRIMPAACCLAGQRTRNEEVNVSWNQLRYRRFCVLTPEEPS